MTFELVTNKLDKISAEALEIEDMVIRYKLNLSDTTWNTIAEKNVRYINIAGHLREWVD